MKNIDVIISSSGLCEKFNCSVEDIKHSFGLYRRGFATQTMRDLPMDDEFISLMGQMNGDLESINDVYKKDIKITDQYLLECEIKKANGTFDEWQNELSSVIPDGVLEKFFSDFSKSKTANPNLPKYN